MIEYRTIVRWDRLVRYMIVAMFLLFLVSAATEGGLGQHLLRVGAIFTALSIVPGPYTERRPVT